MIYVVWILMAAITVILLNMANRFLKDARAIRKELSEGATLKELHEMVGETREELLNDYDRITAGLDKRTERLGNMNRDAEKNIARLEGVLNSERLKTLEERGILFAIETSDKGSGRETDRNKRIADLLKGGASVEEVARITESSVREVELIRLLLRRSQDSEKRGAEGA